MQQYCELDQINGLQNRDFLLTHPAQVSKQFFFIVRTVFHLSLLGIQYKWRNNCMDHLLSAVYYPEHKCLISGDLKVVELVLRLQGWYTKYPCFLSLWNSQADNQHYVRRGFKSDSHNVQFHSLIELNKILLSPLHIKFGGMKDIVKVMDREGSGFAFRQEKFPHVSMEKLKAGIFEGTQIRKLMKDPMFDEALKSEVINFLGNHRSVEYQKEIEELLKSFCQPGAWMSVKLYFLWLHLDYLLLDWDYFPKNCGDLSEEQDEHSHQDIHIIEECYQGQWDVNFLTDYW